MSPDETLLSCFSDLDRHFGRLMEELAGGNNPDLFLAAALASRSSRGGHICLDLAEYAGKPLVPDVEGEREDERTQEVSEASFLSCPPLSSWEKTLRTASVVGCPGEYKPLILDGKFRLYLYRYWFYENSLIRFIRECVSPGEAETVLTTVSTLCPDFSDLGKHLHGLFPEDCPSLRSDGGNAEKAPDWQKIAALAVLRNRFVVISGSPGTGKTTTAARTIALLQRLNRGRTLRIALAAPTGKAAVRLEEAISSAGTGGHSDNRPGKAMTLHRLLGAIPHSPYFRHDRDNPLPYDLIIVDEASMVDLPLMAKLVQALSPACRLILLGDRDQLASVEAGAVLGDLCGPADAARFFTRAFLEDIKKMTGEPALLPISSGNVPAVSDSIVQLQKNHRFTEESGIGRLSRAVNRGDIDRVFDVLNSSRYADLVWKSLPESWELARTLSDSFMPYFKIFMQQVGDHANTEDLFDAFERFRILCALRRGPFGVEAVNALVENLLRSEHLISGSGKWYPGRPLMITRNDYTLGLFNGDVGLTLPDRSGNGLSVFFRDPECGFRRFAPFRLPEHETVFAVTVHKSQGSEFDEVLMILADRAVPLLTRELIYTGVTRAKKRLFLWGSEEVLRQAVSRRITRISGLRDALWDSGSESGA